MLDTLETAGAYGVSLQPDHPLLKPITTVGMFRPGRPPIPFDELMDRWGPLPFAINSINRGMGLPDLYPFVIPSPAIDKLRFIHEIIGHYGGGDGTGGLASRADRTALQTAPEFQRAYQR